MCIFLIPATYLQLYVIRTIYVSFYVEYMLKEPEIEDFIAKRML